MKRRLLVQAARDLAGIEAFLAADNPRAAADVAERLRTSLELITARPEIGRPTMRAHVREWSVPGLPYVIPYRVKPGTIEILRVFHTSRERPKSW